LNLNTRVHLLYNPILDQNIHGFNLSLIQYLYIAYQEFLYTLLIINVRDAL